MNRPSASASVSAALDAMDSSAGTINAFTARDEGALDRAAAIDEQMAEGDKVGPLAGIPIAVKDIIDHRGRNTTCGSAFYSMRADATAPVVERLETAGAIIIGRANLNEWAFGFNSENEFWGPVRNPWDLDTSAGGSSGGSGAAVAAGIVPIAIGTDTGGSVRVPAALCGTFGLKVTYGSIPLQGVFPLVPSVDTVGPLADSMANLDVSYRVMSGDTRSAPLRDRLRIGVPEPWFSEAPMEGEIDTAFRRSVEAIADLGHEVHPIELPDVGPSRAVIGAIHEVVEVHAEFRRSGKEYSAAAESRISEVEASTAEDIEAGRRWQLLLRDRFEDAFKTVDLLVTPTVPVRRKVIGEDMIGDRHHIAVLSYFSSVVNHALHPALAAPLLNSGTPPASIQMIGAKGSEPQLLDFGSRLEEAGVVGFEVALSNSPTPADG